MEKVSAHRGVAVAVRHPVLANTALCRRNRSGAEVRRRGADVTDVAGLCSQNQSLSKTPPDKVVTLTTVCARTTVEVTTVRSALTVTFLGSSVIHLLPIDVPIAIRVQVPAIRERSINRWHVYTNQTASERGLSITGMYICVPSVCHTSYRG